MIGQTLIFLLVLIVPFAYLLSVGALDWGAVRQVASRVVRPVLRAAGLECTGLLDEPSAANNVLQVQDGAIVDVGGGTTGVAVVRGKQIMYTADEQIGRAHV